MNFLIVVLIQLIYAGLACASVNDDNTNLYGVYVEYKEIYDREDIGMESLEKYFSDDFWSRSASNSTTINKNLKILLKNSTIGYPAKLFGIQRHSESYDRDDERVLLRGCLFVQGLDNNARDYALVIEYVMNDKSKWVINNLFGSTIYKKFDEYFNSPCEAIDEKEEHKKLRREWRNQE